jgi:G2/mitotic-specific cyclin-B2
MTERYVRQTYKNLLGGNTNTTNCDENLIAKNKNILLTKAANLINSVSSNTLEALTNTNSSSTNNTNTEMTLSQGDGDSQTCNLRNALGDIGNKLTGLAVKVNSHNLIKQHSQEEALLKKKDLAILQPKQQIVKQQVVQAPVIPQIVVQSATMLQESSNNNSCSMIEIESSEDEDEDEDDCDESTDDNCIIIEEEAKQKGTKAAAEDWGLPSDVQDIDEPDIENTQLVAEYVKDIYYYLNYMERKFRVSPTFLENKIVTTKMRSVLIDWLIQVHLKFHLLHETLYLCVQIIDAYLEAMDVSKMQLQLVGVTAMFVASKYEEMYVPAIEDFVYMTDNTYTKSEIRQMEISILKTLNFMFGKPLPLHFLRRFSKAGRADPKQHTLGKYFMELSLHDAEFSNMDPSYLAAASLCLSFRLLNGPAWNRQLEYYSTYTTSKLVAGMQKLAKLVLKSADLDYKYRAATNKYGASKFMRISLLPELTGSFIKELAANGTF